MISFTYDAFGLMEFIRALPYLYHDIVALCVTN